MTSTILRRATALALVAPFALASCITGDAATDETISEARSAEAETAAQEELDPNDPNVMVCPVTGAMQRIDDDAGGHHSDGDLDF